MVHTFENLNCLYLSLCTKMCQSNTTASGHHWNCTVPFFSQNALVYRLTVDGNGYGGGSSMRCCTIRLVPFPLIALTLSHLACDTSNAGAFLRPLIDQNKHIIL